MTTVMDAQTFEQMFSLYSEFVDRGVSLEDDTQRERLLLGLAGLAGESGEVVDVLKKHIFHGKELSAIELIHEMGDVLWYYTLIMDTIGIQWDEIVALNYKKLTERYPERHSA